MAHGVARQVYASMRGTVFRVTMKSKPSTGQDTSLCPSKFINKYPKILEAL